MIVTSVPFAFAANSYAITHQPAVDEFYVETNDAKDTVVDEGSKLVDTPDEPGTPDTPDEPADEACGHMCHKTGFMGMLWKIIRTFLKLFRMSPVCDCGAAHY